jgi:hypothetical protein
MVLTIDQKEQDADIKKLTGGQTFIYGNVEAFPGSTRKTATHTRLTLLSVTGITIFEK